MNVLLVTQRYHPCIGGIETHVRQVAHALSRHHNVTVAAVNFRSVRLPARLGVLDTNILIAPYHSYQDGPVSVRALTPTLLERLRLMPILTRTLPLLQRRYYHALERSGYRWYRRVYVPKLRQAAATADIIHALAGGYLGWAAQEAARERGIPFVCTPFVHPHQWGDGPHDVAYYKRCDAVVALVESDREYLRSLGVPPARVHVIGVSPDLPEHCDGQQFRQRHGLGDAPVVLYIGRMMPQKGAFAVLRSAAHVWHHVPEARFVFIGPGSAESVQWFAETDRRVLHLGKVSASEKADALAACDVFCMPSRSEILPTVYLEAWSLGKPVVGGLAHGLQELVEDHGGGICVDQDPEAVAVAVLRLLRDPAERSLMGQRGKQLVQRKYSVLAVTRALAGLYTELISQQPLPRYAS